MLRNVKDAIKKNYYDPEFHGVNLDETFKTAEEKINEATTNGQIFGIIEKALLSLNDTHASEFLSRVVQIEKRGTVIGDVTAGAVMESRGYSFSLGESSLILYGASITDADIVMTDGKSLEHTGVSPDKIMLPAGADLREQEDPVLSYAASLAGVKVSPKEAGALFPIRWKLRP